MGEIRKESKGILMGNKLTDADSLRDADSFPDADRGMRGVTAIEVLVGIPIFLVVILYLLWIPVTNNAAASLSAAVGNGLRLGITRGNLEMMGVDPRLTQGSGRGVIPAIEQFQASGNFSGVKDFFASPDLAPHAQAIYDYWSQRVFSRPFHQLPLEYLFTIAYINIAMKRSHGKGLRFPCLPQETSSHIASTGYDDPFDGRECLMCRFINPYAGKESQIFTPVSNYGPPLFLMQA